MVLEGARWSRLVTLLCLFHQHDSSIKTQLSDLNASKGQE